MSNPVPTADIGIIGAGLAGLSLALSLTAAGKSVLVLDKGRGPGGRLSTRRAGVWQFDHGGQFMTVRDAGLSALMPSLVAGGYAAAWNGRVVRLSPDGGIDAHPVERFVGTPGMNGIIRGLVAHLPEPARPTWGVQVTHVTGSPGAWTLMGAEGIVLGHVASWVAAVPSPQAAPLLRPHIPALADRAAAATMAPAWALMLGFDGQVGLDWDAAFIAGAGGDERPLSWIARDGSKPGRAGQSTFIAHGSPDWSVRHLEETPEQVIPALLAGFRTITGIDADPAFIAAHRWRYALPTAPLAEGFLWDATQGIGACGDWCLDARAEAAFVSGARLAAAMRPL